MKSSGCRKSVIGSWDRICPRSARLGQRMMKQTATVQTNIDFLDEKDAMVKFRTGMGLAPLLIGMFANSPICDGQLNGYRSFREHIWTDTDRSRSGLLKFAFQPDASFAHYVEYALDVPMYFIIRNHDYVDMTGMTFRQFMQYGHGNERATIEDWSDHLTTLFPETRIKRYIEIRSVDSQSPELMPALSALAKGGFTIAIACRRPGIWLKAGVGTSACEVYLDSHQNALARGSVAIRCSILPRNSSRSPGKACAGKIAERFTAKTKRFISNR